MAITATLTAALLSTPAAMARGGGASAPGATAARGGASAAGATAARGGTPAAAGTTGRLLVQLKPPPPGTATASAARVVHAVAARADARTAITVPQLRLAAVAPRTRGAAALKRLERRLREDPRVATVRPELQYQPRLVPDDPALTAPERGDVGTTVEWWAQREDLPVAWDTATGDGARVAIIDTGVDATHPDLQNKIVASADFDDNPNDGPATTDETGHGTHVASLACGQAGNGIGIAGAGMDCGLLVAKSDLTETSVIAALTWAADNGAEAINMSFGTDGRFAASPQTVAALQYATSKGAVLVAAAADAVTQEQGVPANVLQPTNTGPDINTNFGLTVTAATAKDRRADFAGLGSQVSIAAYGTYGPGGPSGLLGAFPAQRTLLERQHHDPTDPLGKPIPACQCRTTFEGDNRYAYLRGTSMAAPQVAAVAALMRHLNPDLPPADVVRILKQTAARPGAAWSPDLGWGILDAGSAVAAARSIDFHPPTSQLERPKVRGRSILLRWRGEDDAVAGVVASGIDHFEVWRATPRHAARKIKATRAHSLRLRGRRGSRYSFFTIAVDHAGNREPPPVKADASVRVAR